MDLNHPLSKAVQILVNASPEDYAAAGFMTHRSFEVFATMNKLLIISNHAADEQVFLQELTVWLEKRRVRRVNQ